MKPKEGKKTESRKECIPSSSIDCIKASLNPKSMSNLQSTKKKVDLVFFFFSWCKIDCNKSASCW